MELGNFKEKYRQLILQVKDVLIKCGVPEKAIAEEVVMRSHAGRRQDADILILGEDNKTIVSQFEVKIGPDAYKNAIRSLRDMPQRHKCYVVTRINDEGMVSAVSQDRQDRQSPNWVRLSNLNGVVQLLGNYKAESDLAASSVEERKQQITSTEWDSFRWVFGVVGMMLVLAFSALEWFGHEFSWKVYILLFGVLAMFSVASGYAVHVKVGENEFTIEKKMSESNKGVQK